jgi:hypothetical protein
VLNELLGGGVCPRYLLGIGAKSAGAGKTSLLMQVVEGLAMRSAELVRSDRPGPLTPVLLMSEMPVESLVWRSLGRMTGYDSSFFRAGAAGVQRLMERERGTYSEALAREFINDVFGAARLILADSIYSMARTTFLRSLSPKSHSASELVRDITAVVNRWAQSLSDEFAREVWPVVVMDPIQRWQDNTRSEVEALNALAEEFHAATSENGWIGIITSDTNKAAATDRESDQRDAEYEKAISVFRGSYKLVHLCDAALSLAPVRNPDDEYYKRNLPVIEVKVAKNRWGIVLPRPEARAFFQYDAKTGRFTSTGKPSWYGAKPAKEEHSRAKGVTKADAFAALLPEAS